MFKNIFPVIIHMGDYWVPDGMWLNASYVMDVLLHQFQYAIQWTVALGGITFIYATFSLLTVLYTYFHFKNTLVAGLVAVVLGLLGMNIPEVVMLGYVLLGIGFATIAYRVLRALVG
jgi:hypothetical protein